MLLSVLIGRKISKYLVLMRGCLKSQVACHRLGNQDAAETIAKLQAEIREMRTTKPSAENKEMPSSEVGLGCQTNLKEEITRLHSQGNTIANLEAQLENVQRSIDKLVMSLPNIAGQMVQCGGTTKSQSAKKKKVLPLTLGGNMNR
jgi:centromeric protein E